MWKKEKIIPLIDLTSLNGNESEDDIINLCKKASTPLGDVASICIHKEFIPIALKNLKKDIKITTVINFPHGNNNLNAVLEELHNALTLGANEIDVVMPYGELLNGNYKIVEDFLKAVKKNCENNILKVILETGELKSESNIRLASKIAIHGGADFLKTSTGKVPINATIGAAKYMLQEIDSSKSIIGFKAAGGIKTHEEACAYLDLVKEILSEILIQRDTLRFGASSLLDDLLNNHNTSSKGGY